MKKAIVLLFLCAGLLLTACAAQTEAETTQPEQERVQQEGMQPEPIQKEPEPVQPAAAAADEDKTPTEQDVAWFAQAEACADWPALTVDGTSIYELEQDDIERVYGASARIYHGMEIGTDYYDIVQFADGSQAAGWMGTDGKIRHPNAAYLRLDAGIDVCGIRAGEDYRAAANRFPRDETPQLQQLDEHTAQLLLGGEILYMGKYSYLEYTDGVPEKLVVCDETEMTLWIEDGGIAAVSWMAPEEAIRLPVTEQWAQERMTILTEGKLRAALQQSTGEGTENLAALFWAYDGQNGNPFEELPAFSAEAIATQPMDDETWDALSLFAYKRYARENGWPLMIGAEALRDTFASYFPLDSSTWQDRSSHYLTYQDGIYTRTVYDDGHHSRYCYLRGVQCKQDGSIELRFDSLELPADMEYETADASIRAVFDYAGATELQPPVFREAVWQAFSAGVLPLEGNNTGRIVTLCLTGDAAQPFLFMECN